MPLSGSKLMIMKYMLSPLVLLNPIGKSEFDAPDNPNFCNFPLY